MDSKETELNLKISPIKQISTQARSSGDSQYSVGIQYGTGSRVSGIKKNFEVGGVQISQITHLIS